ncbi:MAG: hypothetical protein FWE95_09730 [Planctomycetaceae bacterium]|nr:hypothetical protein [Planctomycetaceae bacterium]
MQKRATGWRLGYWLATGRSTWVLHHEDKNGTLVPFFFPFFDHPGFDHQGVIYDRTLFKT